MEDVYWKNVSLAGLFIPKNPLVHVMNTFGNIDIFSDDDNLF